MSRGTDRQDGFQTLSRALALGVMSGLEEAARLLGEMRPMDPSGPREALGRSPGLGELVARGAGAAEEVLTLLEDLAGREECLGCGTCCRAGGPTLYLEDREFLGPRGPGWELFHTLRPGEMVRSARLGSTFALESEMIALKPAPGGGCPLRTPEGCREYARRPRQCRHLECWSGKNAGELEHLPRLTRREVFAGDATALALAGEYDLKIPAGELAQILDRASGGDQRAGEEARALLELDMRLRAGIAGRYGYLPEVQGLLLGRPAAVVARAHGLGPDMHPAG